MPPDLNQLIQLQQGLGRSGPFLGSQSQMPTAPRPFAPAGMAPPIGGYPNAQNQFLGGMPGPMVAPLGGFGGDQFGSGSWSSETLPGEMRAPVQNTYKGGTDPFNRNQLAEQAMRNSQYALAQASGFGADGFTRNQNMAEAQGRAILGGTGSWQPGQPMPLIPGMAGGPVGAGALLPSLPAGGGYGGGQNTWKQPAGGGSNYDPRPAQYQSRRSAYMNSPGFKRSVETMNLNRQYGF